MKTSALLSVLCLFAFTVAAESQVIIRSSLGDGTSIDGLPGVLSSLGIGGGSAKSLPNGTAQLLRLPQIKEELGLGDDQIEAIGRLSQAMNKQMAAVVNGLDFTSGDTGKLIQAAQRKIRIQNEEKLEELLTPRQLDRFKQIKVQSVLRKNGAKSLLSDELSQTLKLSDKQRTHLTKLHAQKQKELSTEIEDLRKQYREETISEVLTKEQLKKLEKLSGEPYAVKKPDLRSMFEGLRSLPNSTAEPRSSE